MLHLRLAWQRSETLKIVTPAAFAISVNCVGVACSFHLVFFLLFFSYGYVNMYNTLYNVSVL